MNPAQILGIAQRLERRAVEGDELDDDLIMAGILLRAYMDTIRAEERAVKRAAAKRRRLH